MIINIEKHRRKKKMQTKKVEMIEVPVYVSIYMEGTKLIGEFKSGNIEVITDYGKE